MLGPGRYLLGVAELVLIVGSAWLGAGAVRRRLVPELGGAPGQGLATAVLAIAGLLWIAEVLGTVGWFKAGPYLIAVTAVGLGLWALMGGRWGRPSILLGFSPGESGVVGGRGWGEKQDAAAPEGRPHRPSPAALVALAIAAVAVVRFGLDVKPKLSTGMTGFDSTWYHGTFAAGFFQSGDTWSLHFIAPQFLAWFYPANSEVLHAVGMGAFHRDLLSPLLNLGWFVGCLVAGWCIGRPYKAAPISLALTAVALSVPALSDQAGEARNDIVGIFFLLAAVAVALNAWAARSDPDGTGVGEIESGPEAPEAHRGKSAGAASGLSLGALVVTGLAAGLAAGTKLNFLLPAGVLVVGFALIAPRGRRWRALAATGLAALAGGGYWYLRNLAQTGNPLPWVKHLGPIALPAPEQALGGREGHSVFGYLTDGSAWSDWFLPGLHHGLTILWPVLGAAALVGLLLCLGRRATPVQRVAGLVGLAAALAWLIAPTSASGPDGSPHGFESGLRYLAPALVLGLALLPTTRQARRHIASLGNETPIFHAIDGKSASHCGRGVGIVALGIVLVAVGYPVQRHYLDNRYANPTFTTPGLNAAFKWAQGISGARIATTSTRQYPLYGKDLTNHVDYIGEEQPHGGFTAPTTCQSWRRLLNAGDYDYAITTRDRIEPGKPPYPPTARWTEAPGATVVLLEPPTIVFKLTAPLDSSECPSGRHRSSAGGVGVG